MEFYGLSAGMCCVYWNHAELTALAFLCPEGAATCQPRAKRSGAAAQRRPGKRSRPPVHRPERGQPREQQVWTYRLVAGQGRPSVVAEKPPESPPIVADVVASVLSATAVELAWKPPSDAGRIAYQVERAVVEVWSDDQLRRLVQNTPPLERTSVGAIRRIGRFETITSEPITSEPMAALLYTDQTVDLRTPRLVEGEPLDEQPLSDEQLDRAGRPYPWAVFAYRVRTVAASGNRSMNRSSATGTSEVPRAPNWRGALPACLAGGQGCMPTSSAHASPSPS